MKLKDLKKMIAEEYSKYLSEQGEPEVAVSDADVDMEGGEDAEATLRDIYNMLKSYFEGGAEGGGAAAAAADDDMADDTMDDLEDMEDAGDAGDADDADTDDEEDEDEVNENKYLHEVKRLKKLANIIK